MEQSKLKTDRYHVLSVTRTIDILETLYRVGRAMSIKEIAAELGVPPSSIHRVLSTLEARHYVQQEETSKRYWLGISLYCLGMAFINSRPATANTLHSYLVDLATQTNECAHLGMIDFSEGVPKVSVVDKVTGGNRTLSYTPAIGSRTTAYASALGKVLLAQHLSSSPEWLPRIDLRPITPATITDHSMLLDELRHIKADGFAIDNEEGEAGLMCIAAPILGPKGESIAALSCSGPDSRMRPRLDQIRAVVCELAGKASNSLAS